MSGDALLKELERTFELTPSKAIPSASRVGLKRGVKLSAPCPPMTDEEWNKFERDIAEAFEKVP